MAVDQRKRQKKLQKRAAKHKAEKKAIARQRSGGVASILRDAACSDHRMPHVGGAI
jgi:hypothetical protein